MDNLIFVPFAFTENFATGVNIVKKSDAINVYLKNLCVALISAKKNNPDSDVALVTNLKTVFEPYSSLLKNNDVKILEVPFDSFTFPKSYIWSLAFYKLCALKGVTEKFPHKRYCYLDSDVFVQSSLDKVWKECDSHILLYDICHGIQVKDYNRFLDECASFYNERKIITHYGGEFFAGNHQNAVKFIEDCLSVYNEIVSKNILTESGDEFILSISAERNKTLIKNAGAYIFRFWTGVFRLVSSCYRFNPVCVLHVPTEKESGMLKLYSYFKKGRYPKLTTVYKKLHLISPSFKVRVKSAIKKIIKK